MIGHESEGSIHSYLMKKKYIYDLSAGGYNNRDLFHVFSINMKLTDLGYKNIEEILAVIGEYI